MPVGPAVCLTPLEVDAGLSQRRQGLVGEAIGADAADQGHLRPEPGGGDGLIGPLAAWHAGKHRTRHRLARTRQPLGAPHQVQVDRPHDGEPGHHVKLAPPGAALTTIGAVPVSPGGTRAAH